MNSRASVSLNTSPQGLSSRTTCAPYPLAISQMRSEKKPFTNTAHFSPGSAKFATAASMPALPVPEIGNVISFFCAEDLPQPILDLLDHLETVRIEIADDGFRHSLV